MPVSVKVLEIPSDVNSISEVEVFVDLMLQERQINEDLYGNIMIALTEAVNNGIVHGNQSDPTKKVRIITEVDHDEKHLVSFKVEDEGPGFDYQTTTDPTTPDKISEEGGRGVFIIKQLADRVYYHKNGSMVEMQFLLA